MDDITVTGYRFTSFCSFACLKRKYLRCFLFYTALRRTGDCASKLSPRQFEPRRVCKKIHHSKVVYFLGAPDRIRTGDLLRDREA